MKPKLFILCFSMAVLSLLFFVQPSYAQQAGTLKVIIINPEAVSAGAQWQVNAGPQGGQWQNSGAELRVPAGQRIVTFKSITGWDKPAQQTLNIDSGRSQTLEARYTRWGVLTVTLNPGEAAAAGAQWRVDGGAWQNSGATVENPPGRFQVDYKSVTGWLAERQSEGVTIISNQAVRLSGNFLPRGYLTVTLQPQEAVRDGAQWSEDGRVWQNSGATAYVQSGAKRIIFRGVEGKWIIPDPVERLLPVGQTLQVTATYRLRPGSLTVTISPQEAVSAGAQWRLNHGTGMAAKVGTWRNSGDTMDVPIGQHELEFKEIPGWVKPANQAVNVESPVRYPRTASYIRR